MSRKKIGLERFERRDRAARAEAARSAPRRIVPTLDDRARARSAAMSGLLEKQLANITDTLAKASQRRNAEMQRRSPQPAVTPTAQTPPASAPTDLYLPETGSSVFSSPGVTFGGSCARSTLHNFGTDDFDLPKANTIMGENTVRATLHGGYLSDDDDPARMLASFETNSAAANAYGDDAEEGDLKTEMLQMWQPAPRSSVQGELQDDIDPAPLLAMFDNTSSAGSSAVRAESDYVDQEQMLSSLERSLSFSREAEAAAPVSVTAGSRPSIDTHPLVTDPDWEVRFEKLMDAPYTATAETPLFGLDDDTSEDPRSMMAAIEREHALAHNNDPKWMLAELERGLLRESSEEDNDDSLDAFRARLTATLSPSPSHGSVAREYTDSDTTSNAVYGATDRVIALDKNLIPHIVALQLEIAGLPWEEIQGWTTYLFSEGLDGYKACQEKDAIVKRADKELAQIISHVTEETKRYLSIQDECRLPCRLVISNIAAGADLGDLQEFFRSFRFSIEDIRILPGRDPIKRTKVAQMDMVSRHYAIRASFMTGSIFGLMLKIELAVEKKD